MSSIPVIFLAFANDRVEGGVYLRNLPLELDGIRKALQPAVQAGLCEVVERANATADQILDIFQSSTYRNRIAVFHYGGHANGYQLLLESLDGSTKSGSSEGLVPFLSKQNGLQLVFLNGCSSQQQTQELIQAGVSSVIGTSQSINDEVATALSVRFYKSLGQGQELKRAWDEAIDSVKLNWGASMSGGNARDLFWEGAEESIVTDHFPWELNIREGSEIVAGWNLPDTVGNPLFNLPPIPKSYGLPESPFLFFKRYERHHAGVFFGRSFYIRDLYQKVTSDKSPPVLLLYGQSGVGKSSLFDAGLKPRLEGAYCVRYLRRNASKGLTIGLMELLDSLVAPTKAPDALATPSSGNPEISPSNQEQTTGSDLSLLIQQLEESIETAPSNAQASLQEALRGLKEAQAKDKIRAAERAETSMSPEKIEELPSPLKEWRQAEEALNQPLFIILDQVEELFTQPIKEQPQELEDLLDLLKVIFGNPATSPKGKILLGYRKEYNPEIEESFKRHQIPRNRLFLESLKKRDILEIFHGLTETPALKERYGLAIENELPDIIADDLLEDKDSAVAPVLQILLTKMWEEALKESLDSPQFTVSKYQELRKQGILLDDFFEQQMQRLREWEAEVEVSGLALDVLHYHTTRLGTSGSHGLDELRRRYQHREGVIDSLIEKFKELYLLNDSGRNATSLAHDTIAPLIQREYRYSNRPGQQASRILENKAISLKASQESNTSLDPEDLMLVEEGKDGMRYWIAQEEELIERSRKRRKNREERQKRMKRASLGTMILILAIAIFGMNQWEASKTLLQDLAESSLEYRSSNLANTNPTLAISMANEYYELKQPNPEPHVTENLKSVLASCLDKETYYTVLLHDTDVAGMDISPDGQYIVTATDKIPHVKLWKTDGSFVRIITSSFDEILKVGFYDNTSVVVHYKMSESKLYDLSGKNIGEPTQPSVPVSIKWGSPSGHSYVYYERKMEEAEALSDRRRSLSKDTVVTVYLQQASKLSARSLTIPISVFENALTFDPSGQWIAYTSTDQQQLCLYDVARQKVRVFEDVRGAIGADFHPNKQELAVSLDNGSWLRLSLKEGDGDTPIQRVNSQITSLDSLIYSPSGSRVMGFDKGRGELLVWNAASGEITNRLRDGRECKAVGFSPDGQIVFKVLPNGVVRLWDLRRKPRRIGDLTNKWKYYFEQPLSGGLKFTQSGKGKLRLLHAANEQVRLLDIDGRRTGLSAPWVPNSRGMIHKKGYIAQLPTDSLRPINYGKGQLVPLAVFDDFIGTEPWEQISMSADASHVVLANKKEVLFWRLSDETQNLKDSIWVRRLPYGKSVKAIAVSNELDALIALEGRQAAWLSHTGQEDTVFSLGDKLPSEATTVAIDSNSNYLAVTNGSQLHIWNTKGQHLEKCPTEINNIQDIIFQHNGEGQISIWIVNGKGIYEWYLLQPLISLLERLQLNTEALKAEVGRELSNFNGQIIYDFSDSIFYKKLLIYFFMLGIGISFIRDWVDRFDRKEWQTLSVFAPTYTFLLFLPLILIADAASKQALHNTLNQIITAMLIPFLLFCALEINMQWKERKVAAAVQALFAVCGLIGYLILGAEESLQFFNRTMLSWAFIPTFLLALLLLPMHRAMIERKRGNKKQYYLLLLIYLVQVGLHLGWWMSQ